MKTEKREVVTKTTEEVFISEDGVTFKSADECKKYEESAVFAVKNQLIQSKKLAYLPTGYKEKTTGALYFGCEMLMSCSDDYDFYLFSPETEEDIKLFIQWARLELSDSCINYEEKARTKEEYTTLAEKLLIDDSDKWDSYRQRTPFSAIEKGKKYIFFHFDGWGQLEETEQIKKGITSVVDAIVEQFGKK